MGDGADAGEKPAFVSYRTGMWTSHLHTMCQRMRRADSRTYGRFDILSK